MFDDVSSRAHAALRDWRGSSEVGRAEYLGSWMGADALNAVLKLVERGPRSELIDEQAARYPKAKRELTLIATNSKLLWWATGFVLGFVGERAKRHARLSPQEHQAAAAAVRAANGFLQHPYLDDHVRERIEGELERINQWASELGISR